MIQNGIVGKSAKISQVLDQIPVLAEASATVLICGETGSGKELFARALHYQSPRRHQPFIPVNCGALPPTLFENELFGHVRGAFTDAATTQVGLLGEAKAGTLFLDEIDALSPATQVKLLRVLQEGEYRKVGSAKTLRADARVVAASNARLYELVRDGTFRSDLYYRLDVLRLCIPPLRERGEDVPALAEHFLGRYAHRYHRDETGFSPGALAKLVAHPWPGNVRELEGVIQRALVLARGAVIEESDIDLSAMDEPRRSHHLEDFQSAKQSTIAAFEHAYLTRLMAVHKGNVSQAAKTAGQNRRTLQRLLAKHHIDRQHYRL